MQESQESSFSMSRMGRDSPPTTGTRRVFTPKEAVHIQDRGGGGRQGWAFGAAPLISRTTPTSAFCSASPDLNVP